MAIVNKIRTRRPSAAPAIPIAPYHRHRRYQFIHTNVAVNLYTWGWSSTQMPNYAETRNTAAHHDRAERGGTGYPMARSSGSCIR